MIMWKTWIESSWRLAYGEVSEFSSFVLIFFMKKFSRDRKKNRFSQVTSFESQNLLESTLKKLYYVSNISLTFRPHFQWLNNSIKIFALMIFNFFNPLSLDDIDLNFNSTHPKIDKWHVLCVIYFRNRSTDFNT